MIPEIQLGVHFIVLNFLVSKLSKQRVSTFARELTESLKLKFKGHWYPKTPERGTAFRCLEIRESVFDPVIVRAARAAGIPLEELRAQLPDSFFLWMDPYEVCYRIGEQGSLSVLKRFNPETYHYDQVSTEEMRLPAHSWEKIHAHKRRNHHLLVQRHAAAAGGNNNGGGARGRTTYSECSSDGSDLESRSRSPDLHDLVNVQPFVPRSNSSPVPTMQPHQQYLHGWVNNVHHELVAVQ